ncbi:intermembrane phospholipid transport protein YdbH family protein [Sphingomonas sp. CJ99]
MSEPPGQPVLNDKPAPASPMRRRRLRRTARFGGIVILMLFAASALIWSQRRPIADGFIRDALVSRGVPARYRIEDIGFRTQRITDLVLGDPANPDLTADWAELDLSLGFGTPEVVAVRAGRVRMRGRVEGGQLRLGALDRLMPPPSGRPFALPEIAVAVADGRARIDTEQGQIGVKLSGSGRLDDGFSGMLGLVAPRLAMAGCQADRASFYGSLRITDRQPRLTGSVRIGAGRCAGGSIGRAAAVVDLALNERLDRWQGIAELNASDLSGADARLGRMAGTVRFDGGPRATTGSVDLSGSGIRVRGATAAKGRITGDYRVGGDNRLRAQLSLDGAKPDAALRQQLASLNGSGAGTPVGPLVDRLAGALAGMAKGVSVRADLTARSAADGGELVVQRLALSSNSGARIALNDGAGARLAWPGGGFTLNGQLAMGGGGLPDGVVRLTQAAPGGPVTGSALLAPYRAGTASLALNDVRFRMNGPNMRVQADAVLSGPLGDGRVDSVRLPIDAALAGGALTVNRACAPLSFRRLAVSSLDLGATRLTLCPAGGAMVRMAGNRVSGGMTTGPLTLNGRLGSAPLMIEAAAAQIDLGSRRFALNDGRVVLGQPDRPNRLTVARLDGAIDGAAMAGRFEGLAGGIANVPLVLSGGAGDWRFADAALSLTGRLDVSDDVNAVEPGQPPRSPRFNPLVSNDVRLTLVDNRIEAAGALTLPEGGATLAQVTIRHDLNRTVGDAVIDVPGIRFDPKGVQPADLTRLALGVVAEVDGVVSGRGTIEWTADGVTSGGVFRTDDTDLAAAFGPVRGLSGEIRFTDLLALESADRQEVRLAEVNPGFAVTDGMVRYRLLAGQKVAIEGGRWPLAGGVLTLAPTVLDFASEAPKRMVFEASGIDAGQFLQQFDFDNLNATGTFDGTIPVVFDASGARVVDGRLSVREGGGTVAYVGELTEEDLGAWGDFAFQALRSLRYRELELGLNGPLAGEMITQIRFAGIAQGEGTKSNFLIRRLARLPLVFNVRIEAPFLQLIDSVQSVYDPARLVQRQLPALLREQAEQEERARPDTPVPPAKTPSPAPSRPVIQPSESETMP